MCRVIYLVMVCCLHTRAHMMVVYAFYDSIAVRNIVEFLPFALSKLLSQENGRGKGSVTGDV